MGQISTCHVYIIILDKTRIISYNIIAMSIYVRTKTCKNKDGTKRDYLCLVESEWDPKKKCCVQRNICNIGRLDDKGTRITAENLSKNLAKYSEKQELLDVAKDIDPVSSKVYGELLIYRKLWEELKFAGILKKYFKKSKKEVDITEAIFAMVCNRLIEPSSKRGTNEWKKDVYSPEWDKYELHNFYRGMDFLIDHKELIEKDIFNRVKDLFNLKVNVIMFDTTSVSYYGKGKRSEELLMHGYPKNKRFDLKQIVIGIIMDKSGMPLGHEVWEGNKSDKPAFKEVIDKIKEKYEIGKVILVSDRGMVSEENIKYLEENNYEYILGVKMRQLGRMKRRVLLSDKGFEKLSNSALKAKEFTEKELYEKVWELSNDMLLQKQFSVMLTSVQSLYGSINPFISKIDVIKAEFYGKTKRLHKIAKPSGDDKNNKRRWIVCLNEIVSAEDKQKREYFQQILENKIEFNTAKEWIVKNGYKKYVIIDEMSIRLNQDKLIEEEIYDGKWVLISNSSLLISEVIEGYKDLAKIERHFRDLKSHLEVGPLFHHTDKRIKAHVFICFLALQLKAAFTSRLKEVSEDLSYSEVLRDLARIKVVELILPNLRLLKRTDFQGLAHFAFKAVKLQIPPKVISIQKFENHVSTSIL
ncbi:MAG TPA: IS1634 family transposase [Methanofastidiosum sp.]|nr:IS1634 family transposase [Methanofastidiosum sp.]